MKSVGLIVGHTPDEVGAVNREQQIGEWHYNATLARMVQSRLQNSYLIFRGRPNDWRGLPSRVNNTGVDFAVSMHLNAYKGDAKGSETLYWHTSENSKRLAQILQSHFVDALGTKDRGVHPRNEGQRGSRLLSETTMPIAICEPFFIDDQLETMQARTTRLAQAYAQACAEYRQGGG